MKVGLGLAAAAIGLAVWAAPASGPPRIVILGDRTGEAQPGVFEKVWKQAVAERPDLILSVGDTIQGLNDATADAEWREALRLDPLWNPLRLYLAPGNHDVWSEASEKLYVKYSGHPLHYSFDFGPAHFTILDNSRSDQFSAAEMAFLEDDLKASAAQPLKFIVSHRPGWIFNVLLRNPDFPLHRLAKKYGVQYVIAGHVHEMLHYSLEGVEYVSMASSGGHLRASGKYEDGWFFGYGTFEAKGANTDFRIHELAGRVTPLDDWGPAGLKKRD